MNMREYREKLKREGRLKEEWAALAGRCGTNPEWLRQLAMPSTGAKPSPRLAKAIERHTGGLVTRIEMLPEVFGL